MSKIAHATSIISLVREEADEAVLFCSLGKDSIVTLDLMAPCFKRIVCVFMYFVKGLEHIERWIKWVKAKYPNVEFLQKPHWSLSCIIRSGFFATPNPNVKLLKLSDVVHSVRHETGIEYVFLGMKKADSMNRRLMLMKYEQDSYIHKGCVYPLADWTQRDVLAYMRAHRLPEPVRYGGKASTGVGFNLDSLLWMKEHFPGDLQKFFKAFPQSERIIWEYEQKNLKKNGIKSRDLCPRPMEEDE